jgi:hypothetical protein
MKSVLRAGGFPMKSGRLQIMTKFSVACKD